jgi:hypothetical protein
MTVRGHSKQTLKSPPKFSYNDKGSMATIGRNKAVADIHFAKFGGFLAWLGWLFISPYISHWLTVIATSAISGDSVLPKIDRDPRKQESSLYSRRATGSTEELKGRPTKWSFSRLQETGPLVDAHGRIYDISFLIQDVISYVSTYRCTGA